MALKDIWNRPSGYNFGYDSSTLIVSSGNFIAGYQYVIRSIGTTDFRKIGAPYNTVGTIFTANGTGIEAGPIETTLSGMTRYTPGTGTASQVAFVERQQLELLLPVSNDTGVSYTLISGKLPGGLRLDVRSIIGSPYEVPRLTDFTFCIRASKGTEISDRTFHMTIDGADAPEFVTPEGLLNIGDNQELFVIDSSYVDYQIEAVDSDTSTGQRLSYFISHNDGTLPPGLVLTDDGRIVGFVQPALSIKPTDGDGTYDNSYYDAVAFDFAFIPTNGYDSYIYDSVFFDFALQSSKPKKLNRTYEFTVTVSDGDSFKKRKFKIFVVGDDFFRADNTTWLDGNPLFTADVTYMRPPVWLTPSYLGLYRANNYLTLILDTYDTENIIYALEQINADCQATTRRMTDNDNIIDSYYLTTTLTTAIPTIGHFLILNGSSIVNRVDAVQTLGNNEYRITLHYPMDITVADDVSFLIGTKSELPPGMMFDENNAEVFGRVPYQPAITKTYRFTVTATRLSSKTEVSVTPKIFTVDLLGEVDSVITWKTDSNLGVINANFISDLHVQATSNITDSTLLYTLVSGRLPPGLSLDLDGEIVGKVNQYNTTANGQLVPGLTTFSEYSGSTLGAGTVTFARQTFDGGSTTIDNTYTFTVQARDQYGYSAVTKTFTVAINTPNQLVYSNIKVRPFLKTEQRNLWREFIDNTSIFTPASVYRPNDSNFGIQTTLGMLVYAGIETKDADTYISAMGLNHKRKRFQFGSVKKAVAFKPGTKTPVYEVVYVEMLDPLEPAGLRLPNKISKLSQQPNKITVDKSNSIWSLRLDDLIVDAPTAVRPDEIITTDRNGYKISNPNVDEYYPSSISNWRDRLRNWKNTDFEGNVLDSFSEERNYLPLWMRSIQPGEKQELDFKLAVPLCYCKPGTADSIILNIKNYQKTNNFNFNKLDYTADRYIIDSVAGSTADKYLVFRNDRITI